MPAILLLGGEAPSRELVLREIESADFICAADSGMELAEAWSLGVDLLVGDMDSISPDTLESARRSVETLTFPRDKDETDAEIGLRLLGERGFDDVCLIGGGGGRIDHVLALRALFERPAPPSLWITARERVLRVDRPMRFSTRAGATVSLFPGARGARGMVSSGLKWPLDGLAWDAGGFGISNEAIAGSFDVDPGAFPLLLILPLDGRIVRGA